MVRIVRVVTTVMVFMFAQSAFAKKGALIDYEDGKASPQLAKSWKKVKDGEYEFELDLSQKVQGKALDTSMVKSSLEQKLAKKYGVAVTAKGDSTVSVVYTVDEDKFLTRVAKTKIRAKSVELAMQGNVSDGGLRADEKVRDPAKGEVVGTIVMIKGKTAKIKVNKSMSTKIKGGVITLNMGDLKAEKTNRVIFTPGKKTKGVWNSTKDVEVYK